MKNKKIKYKENKNNVISLGKEKNSNNSGITLIALVITIIVLLILAGVTISLTIGERGIFKTAQNSGAKMEEAEAREKLERILLELQADKIADTNYNENKYINTKIQANEMIVNGDTVFVNGWQFQIDRNVPKIVSSLGKTETKLLISVPYIGTSSATIKVQYATNEEEIEEYTYIINGEEIKTIKEPEYKLENYFEPETIYKIKVSAKYKNNLIVQSNEIEIKTEARKYLYNNGEECNEITGGWEKGLQTYSGIGEKRDTYLYCYAPMHNNVFSTYYFKTKNKVNVGEYSKLCSKISFTVHSNGDGGNLTHLGIWNGTEFKYYNSTMIQCPKFEAYKEINKNYSGNISVDISNQNKELYITEGICSGGDRDSVSVNIYEVWLET